MNELYQSQPVYFSFAVTGSLLFLAKMALFLFAGDGGRSDSLTIAADIDGDGVTESHADGGQSFSLLSIQSILAFFMGCGWMGLACRQEWGLEPLPSALLASAFGFAMMFLNAFLMSKVRSFDSQATNNINNAVGVRGRAYTDIPEKGKGVGQVELTVNGKQQVINAFSEEKEIKSFASVLVTDVDDSGNLVVREEL